MRINYVKRYIIGIAMTAFLALLAGNAFADKVTAVNKLASRDWSDGDGQYANNFMVVSPYWQVEGGGLIPSSRLPTHRFRVWLHK